MVAGQIGGGKPIIADSTSNTIRQQVRPDVVTKILDIDLAGAPPVDAVNRAGTRHMNVRFTVLDDRIRISFDLCATPKTIAYKTRLDILGDDFDKTGERREFFDEVLHRVGHSQLSLRLRRLLTGGRGGFMIGVESGLRNNFWNRTKYLTGSDRMGKRELRARWRERYDRVPRQKRCLLVRSELCRILGVVKLRPKTFIRINPSGRGYRRLRPLSRPRSPRMVWILGNRWRICAQLRSVHGWGSMVIHIWR